MDKSILTLEFNVRGQLIYYQEENKTVADSIRYLYAKFDFSRDWDINPKYARFYCSNKKSLPDEVQLKNGGCYVPPEIIKFPRFYVSLYCANAVKRITTELQAVSVISSGYAEDTASPLPPGINTIPIHTPANDSKITQFRNNGGVVEFTANGENWTAVTNKGDGAGVSYTHKQTNPDNTWNIQHNLGQKDFIVLTFDTDGIRIYGYESYETSTQNLFQIKFSEPVAGTAILK